METERQRSSILMLLGLAGLLVSILAGLREYLPFLQFLCTTACRETAEVTLLRMPLWLWGVIFYIPVTLVALFRKDVVSWIMAPAAGVEAALVMFLFQMRAPCIYCIANAVIVALLLIFSFEIRSFWRQATLFLVLFVLSRTLIPLENRMLAPGHGELKADIAAEVAGESITDQRLEVMVGSKLFDLKKDIYKMKKEKLEQIIAEGILEKEAAKKGEPVEKFLEQIAPPDGQYPVTDEEVQKYLEENQERTKEFKGTAEELQERIKSYLVQQQRLKLIHAYAQGLQKEYGVRIFLAPPLPPNVRVNVEGAPAEGPADAPVTVVEFSDYQCPACRTTHAVVKQVKELYGDQVRWIFKDFPLKIHKEAFKAAEAAHCAEEQGRFWEYQELAYTAPRLFVGNLVDLAGELGLDKDKFGQCLEGGKYKDYVNQSIHDALNAGIDRTPSFIVNGNVFSGAHVLESLKALIDEELKKAARKK